MSEPKDANQTASQTSAPEETAEPSKGLFHRLQHLAHRKFPRFIPDPEYRHMLAVYREGDDEKNASSELPADEVIDLRCIWAVEFYTSAHIDKLLAGLTSLGWDRKDVFSPGHDAAAWVLHARESRRGGSWLNLGPIYRPRDDRFFGGRTAPLPEDTEFAYGWLHAVTSSITCIVMCFVLKEEAAQRFDQALRRTHETYIEPLNRGYSIIDPPHQKHAAIQTIRDQVRTAAADWFRNHLPGLFS